jgi:hypothetical protein
MKLIVGRERPLTVVSLLLILLLGGVLFWEWDQGLRLALELEKLRIIPSTPAPALTILPEFKLPDAKDGFPELLSRPIFAFGRRPPPVKGDAPVMKKGQFVLVGVLITPQSRTALLRDVQTNKTEAVALVGVVRGLTLGEIEQGRVVLRQGAESEELILNVQSGPKGALPARIPAVPAVPKPAALPPAVPPSSPAVPSGSASSPAGAASVAKPPLVPMRPDPKK